jgi:polyisoprenoid-binding protein YceI
MFNRSNIKKTALGAVLTFASVNIQAQVYVSKTSMVHFFSATALENIEAKTGAAASAFNTQTGDVSIKIPVKSFKFSSNLMEEHFNENYMETEKFPNADFKGKIVDLKAIDFTKDGEYTVGIAGDLTVHGVKKPRTITAIFTIKDKQITGTSKFDIVLDDHKVERPKLVIEKIAEKVAVDVKFEYIPYVKK